MSLATPDLISALAGELSDAQKAAHRAHLVREILAAGPEVRMEHFGGIDPQAAVYVVDVDGLAQVADRPAGLRLAAKELGFTLYEPTPVQQMVEDKPTGQVHWEVWYTYGDDATKLCDAPTEHKAEQELEGALESIVGTMLSPAHSWALAQQQIAAEAPKPVRRKPVYGHMLQATLQATWKAAGVYTWDVTDKPEGKGSNVKHLLPQLDEPAGLQRDAAKGKQPKAKLRMLHAEGRWLANVHDLIAAARRGIYSPELIAYPEVLANSYVVQREFQRYMRTKGWRPLWWQEKPTGGLRLHGRIWMRDKPLES